MLPVIRHSSRTLHGVYESGKSIPEEISIYNKQTPRRYFPSFKDGKEGLDFNMDLNYEDPDREGFPYKRNILSVGTEWGKGTLNRNPQTGARHQKELPHMATALTKPGPGVGSVSVKFQCGVSHVRQTKPSCLYIDEAYQTLRSFYIILFSRCLPSVVDESTLIPEFGVPVSIIPSQSLPAVVLSWA